MILDFGNGITYRQEKTDDLYSIIPQWPSNATGVITPLTVAVEALNDLPRDGTKDGTTLWTGWQSHVESLNSAEAFRVLQIQGLFWVNFPNLWPRVQNIGIMGQRVRVLEIKYGWAKVKTHKLSDTPHYDPDCTHDVYMVNRANVLTPIRSFPVKIILISDAGYLFVPVSRLTKVPKEG
jgi:hypothetical protein